MTAPQTPAPRQAPSTPSQSPFVVKARELEKQLRTQEDNRNEMSKMQRHKVAAMLADLRHIEALRTAGADPRLPRGEMLRRPLVTAAEKNPDLHIRWIDEKSPGRVELVKGMGYVKLAESDGGKQLGESALYGIPRERHGELEAGKRALTASRLRSHKSDVHEIAEKVVDEINAQFGTNLKAKNLLIDED